MSKTEIENLEVEVIHVMKGFGQKGHTGDDTAICECKPSADFCPSTSKADGPGGWREGGPTIFVHHTEFVEMTPLPPPQS